ncbi:RNA 2',3'-cyclic phosphodiesterase [Candidatus Woesearchaeota archaeon]|nr:RNA 2',3'-cyclic phosphodiesterase [Candidatus Woesearchaeota archaeon]
MRLFLAIDLSEEAKQSIERVKEGLKGIKGVKPVAKDNIHLTLKFLGEVDDDKVDGIINALSQVKFQPFNIFLNKPGAFPNENRISVLWVDASPAEPLIVLKKDIDKALPRFKDDHPFKTHITFARVKYIANQDDKKKIIDLLRKPVDRIEFSVDKFILYKSTLLSEGPVYEVVKEFSL